jgi:hypothetical protein
MWCSGQVPHPLVATECLGLARNGRFDCRESGIEPLDGRGSPSVTSEPRLRRAIDASITVQAVRRLVP